MSTRTAIPFNAPASCTRHILVLEPADLVWLGVQALLHDAGITNTQLWRLRQANQLKEFLSIQLPDVLLLSSVTSGTGLLPLLQQLSLLTLTHSRLRVVACLQQETPYLSMLLRGFGIDKVFTPADTALSLVTALNDDTPVMQGTSQIRFTPKERQVLLALLNGHSVTWVAQQLGKDIRTVSAQKLSVINKLRMTHSGELQVLGGRLMTTETAQNRRTV